MDPEQTLLEAREAADSGLVADATYLLDAYRQWRSLGGFEPEGGDMRARNIRRALGRQARSFEGGE